MCLSISSSISTVTRRRASDAPASFVTLRRKVSPTASNSNARRSATQSSTITATACPDCSARNAWTCAVAEACRRFARRCLSRRHRRRAIEFDGCSLHVADRAGRPACGLDGDLPQLARGRRQTRDRVVQIVANHVQRRPDQRDQRADDQHRADGTRNPGALEHRDQRPQRVTDQDAGDHRHEDRLRDARRADHHDSGNDDERDFDRGQHGRRRWRHRQRGLRGRVRSRRCPPAWPAGCGRRCASCGANGSLLVLISGCAQPACADNTVAWRVPEDLLDASMG